MDPVPRGSTPSRAGDYYRSVATELSEVTPHVAAWAELAGRSVDDNVYASPRILIPALRHFGREHPYFVVFVYRRIEVGTRLVACAPFSLLPPSTSVPVPTLSTFRCPYTYLAQPLLDRSFAPQAVSALWDWIDEAEQPWRLVMLQQFDAQSATWALMESELARRGRRFWVKERQPRAILKRADSFAAFMETWSNSRRKKVRRLRRRLERVGTVETTLYRGLDGTPDLASRFMEMEALGWKGEAGTALMQDPSGAAFFTEITRACANRGDLFYVEVTLDGRPIAMTTNFILGSTLFAFKVAYDPEFKKHSPGILAEVETIRLLHETPGLERGDSGTSGTSYLDRYWRDATSLQVVLSSTDQSGSDLLLRTMRWAAHASRALGRGFGLRDDDQPST